MACRKRPAARRHAARLRRSHHRGHEIVGGQFARALRQRGEAGEPRGHRGVGQPLGMQLRVDVALDAGALDLLDRRGGRPETHAVQHVEDGALVAADRGRRRPGRQGRGGDRRSQEDASSRCSHGVLFRPARPALEVECAPRAPVKQKAEGRTQLALGQERGGPAGPAASRSACAANRPESPESSASDNPGRTTG